jgi:hypothetical protein
MVIVGRIYDIVVVNDKVAQIILRKKMNDKIVPIAISLFGYWKDKIFEMKLKPKDKIKANIYMKSKIWNGKWYTDVYFRQVYLIEEAPRPMNERNLFEMDTYSNVTIVDEDTGFTIGEGGEIIE